MKNQKKVAKLVSDEEKVKAKELILLISELSESDEKFGVTKLNKLLFFIDFLAYLGFGKPVSGASYVARPEGPMLESFYDLREEMEASGDLVISKREHFGYEQHKPIAVTSADGSKFSGEEMKLFSKVISTHRNMNASRISALSHGFLGWQAVDFEEEIPYETALVSTEDLTQDQWGFPANVELGKLGIDEADLISQ